jgi:hypothetical protein
MAYITSFSNTWPKALAQRYPRHAIDIVVDIVSLPNKLLGLLHYNHIILRCRRTSTHLPLLKFDHTSRYTPPCSNSFAEMAYNNIFSENCLHVQQTVWHRHYYLSIVTRLSFPALSPRAYLPSSTVRMWYKVNPCEEGQR